MIGIIGGSGFIGTQLCARLSSRGDSVVIIDKLPSHFFPQKVRIADVRDVVALTAALHGCSLVYNLAAEHRDDVQPRELYDHVNVGGARNLCIAMQKQGIKSLVFTSSVAVYGSAPPNTDESGALMPGNDYGRTKLEAETVYHEWADANPGSMLTVVRPSVVFGPRNRGNIYNLLRQISSRRFLMVGDGSNVKSMAYVENVAAFLEYGAGLGPGMHLFNYVDKPDLDMNSLVLRVRERLGMSTGIRLRVPFIAGYLGGLVFDLARKVTGRRFPISALRVKKFCSTSQFDSTSRGATDFAPPFSLLEGLAKTIDYEFRGGAEQSADTEVVFRTE